jgi:hypothetical protein
MPIGGNFPDRHRIFQADMDVSMKLLRLTGGIWALAASCLAHAAGQAPDPKALALADGMLSYCAKAVPSTAATYQKQVKRLTQGAGNQSLAQVRASVEYHRARESIDEFVGKVDEHNASRVCHETVAQNK